MIARAFPPISGLTADDALAVEDVLDAAASWQRGEIPFPVAASIGALVDWRGQPSPSYSRYVALHLAGLDDPRRAALRALLDVLVRAEGYVVTRQGVFSSWEIRQSDAEVATAHVGPFNYGGPNRPKAWE